MGKKNTETAESGKEERGCIFVLRARLNVHDHVHLMKKQRKGKQREEAGMIERKEALFAYSLLSKGSCFELHVWPDVVHTFVVIWAKISLTRRNLIRISRYFSAPLCSDNPWWSFQVAHKLAQNNSRSHRNFILLTACSFTCVSAVCAYNAWTRPEPPVSSFWLWRALCLCGFSPECCGRSG